MAETSTLPHGHQKARPESTRDPVPTKQHRLSLRQILGHKKSHSAPEQPHYELITPRPKLTRLSTGSGIHENVPNAIIASNFLSLFEAISKHVLRFYSVNEVDDTSQKALEHATTRLAIPWPQVLSLLGDTQSRQGALSLCISYTILSRSLLLKLGISNSPGSTFLPPEIVECFQSFSLCGGVVCLRTESLKAHADDFALLSKWRQFTASLMHSTYVDHAFSHFDSRTINVERALNDLDALLRAYADTPNPNYDNDARLTDLRDILRKGATFAFTLFGHPSFWQFDWNSERGQSDTAQLVEKGRTASTVSSNTAITIDSSNLVIWPTLLRIMDEKGNKLDSTGKKQKEVEREGLVFGKKRYLDDFKDTQSG